MIRTASRTGLLVLVAWLVILTAAPAAWADAAGPTDYRSEIVSIEPADAPIEVEMIGGDAFIRLVQLEPVEIIVIGYRGEDYLRFDADGTVVENRRSPTTYQNEERFGSDELPAYADYEAPPEWRRVGAVGAYSWHDHRSHWMNPVPPLGTEPGDQVDEAVVPLLIDGQPVSITVASYLLEDPPIWPGIAGALIAAAFAALGLSGGRAALTVVGTLISGGALLLGMTAFRSVPPETQPDRLLWLLPLIALAALLIVAVVRNRLATTVYLDGLATAAGALLIGWSVTRFSALTRSLIPSDAPATIDRLVIGAAIVTGVVLVLRGMWGLVRPQRLIDPATPLTA